ncbi:heparinase II/III-family protein [Porticoccaceae bacterium]|nr:heparinase II/III-family protein [Porticoccaceae bacterium]
MYFDPHCDYLYLFSFLYFDCVHQLDDDQLERFVLNDLKNLESQKNFYHPYVASKRIINLVLLWSSRDNFDGASKIHVMQQIHKDCSYLYENIEYHIDGNHLLTNYAALAIYERFLFDNQKSKYFNKYLSEFSSQFEKGLHYERSISYTSQLLHESFLVFQLYKSDTPSSTFSLIDKSLQSLRFFENLGNRVDFGDNIFEQSFKLDHLTDLYSRAFQIPFEFEEPESPAIISDYVSIFNNDFSVCVDCGSPSPVFQPGHAHDSSGAIELSFRSSKIFISGNVSTYENCERRLMERSRFNYSKVVSEGSFQNVWSSFRVAQRVRPRHISSRNNVTCVIARGTHGFERSVFLTQNGVSIVDSTAGSEGVISQFIVSGNCAVSIINSHNIVIDCGCFQLALCSSGAMTIEDKNIAIRFGVREATKLIKCTTNQTENILNIRENHL